MFIGNHRGFSCHFHGFWPYGGSCGMPFDARKTRAFRRFAPGWFAAKFALKTHQIEVRFLATTLEYFGVTHWQLQVKPVHGMAVRCKIKPNKAQSLSKKNQHPLIGEYRCRPTWRKRFLRNVLPNVRRYLPRVSAPWPDGPFSAALGRHPTYLSEARFAFKCAPNPLFGSGFGEGERGLHRAIKRCGWPGA